MKILILKMTVLIALISPPAFGMNFGSVAQDLEFIRRSYDPLIQVRALSSGTSFHFCRYEEFEITGMDPVLKQPRKMHLNIYWARNGERENAVIILPPTGGTNVLDRGYANDLCSSGTTAAILADWDFQNEVLLDFEMHNRGALRAVAATRHAVEYLKSKKFSQIGLLGTSIGAISASMVVELEPRISTAVFIVGAARFADVVAESDENGAREIREKRMKAFGIQSQTAYKEAVRKAVPIDPSRFLQEIKALRSLTVVADSDHTVPTQLQKEFSKNLLRNSEMLLSGNHFEVIKDAFFNHREEIVNFLNANLKAELSLARQRE